MPPRRATCRPSGAVMCSSCSFQFHVQRLHRHPQMAKNKRIIPQSITDHRLSLSTLFSKRVAPSYMSYMSRSTAAAPGTPSQCGWFRVHDASYIRGAHSSTPSMKMLLCSLGDSVDPSAESKCADTHTLTLTRTHTPPLFSSMDAYFVGRVGWFQRLSVTENG